MNELRKRLETLERSRVVPQRFVWVNIGESIDQAQKREGVADGEMAIYFGWEGSMV